MPLTYNNTDHFEHNEMLPRSYQEDIVEESYKIHTDRSVNELSNQFCRYYFATHLQSEKEYFAIVFERSFNPAIHNIELLKKHPTSSINKIVAYSLVKLSTSRKYQFVVIVESYDPYETLQHYIEEKGPIQIETIQNTLLPSLVRAIEFCQRHGINCSNINPQNIIVTKNNTFILRECISTLPNFYQPLTYLAPELGDTIETGRTKNGVEADIYALGMTIYYATTAVTLTFGKHNPQIANAERIEEGSYNAASRKAKIPKLLREFFVGTLNDNPLHRWNIEELTQWLSSQTTSKHNVARKPEAYNHTILFEGHNYANPAALSSAMYNLYEAGIKFFREENFLKWAQRVRNKGDNIDELIPLTQSNNNSMFYNIVDNETEERMLKMLSKLDCFSPLRIKDLCITLESIPNILFFIVYNDNKLLLERLSQVLRRNYWKIILSPEYKEQLPHGYVDTLITLSSSLSSNTEEYISKQQLYKLDPYVPCLSPSVVGDYVLTMGDLLVALEKIAAHSASKLHIDEHIAAFIYSRLTTYSVAEEKLKNMPEHLAKSIMMQGVFLLSIAQDYSVEVKVPHLCSIVAQKLIEWINDNLHSAKLKKIITSEIAELSTTGSLSQMLYVISNPQLFYNDYRGYKVANKQVTDLDKEIKYLSDEDRVYDLGVSLGQKLTVLFSYFLCMLVSLILII